MIKKAPEHPSQLFRMKKSSLLQLVAITLAIIVLVPQLDEFKNSWKLIIAADPLWLLLASLGLVSAAFFATLVYMALVPKHLPFKRTGLIQVSTYFTNRLLPSGLGGIGFNAMYLVKQAKLTRTESAVYATANNLIGFVAFVICASIATITTKSKIQTELPLNTIALILVAVAIIVALLLLTVKSIQKKLIDFLGHLFGVILEMIKHPGRIALAVLLSTGITISYAGILWATTKSVGVELPIIDIFIAFVVGNTALTISPTPGGLGAVEAAITAVVISANVEPALALASVVLFRLISYWIPIIPGYIAFRRAVKKEYV